MGTICQPFALASGLNRMSLNLTTPALKPDARPDASAFGSLQKLIRLAWLSSVRVSFIVLSQAVFAKVVFEIPPHHVSMVCAVLSVVVL